MVQLLSFLFLLVFVSNYNWIDSFTLSDTYLLDNSSNWEHASHFLLNDDSPMRLLFTSVTRAIYIFTDMPTRVSLLDLVFLSHDQLIIGPNDSLFFFYMIDLFTDNFFFQTFLNYFFFADYQNSILILMWYVPEIALALNDYDVGFWQTTIFSFDLISMYDLFLDYMGLSILNVFDNLILLFLFFWVVILGLNFFSLNFISVFERFFLGRIFLYVVSLAIENRVQLEIFVQLFFWIFLFFSLAIMTFDDDDAEYIEIIDIFFFKFFLLLLIYLVYRYSIHYFAFLEATDASGRSALLIIKQFFRDFMGSLGLFLRFAILLFRLNVYDNLDDLYDSYYIFVGDFDDDEYLVDSIYNLSSTLFFTSDTNDDSSLFMEEESDWSMDLYYIYFYIWGKLFFFLFLFIEEFFRVSLALYIAALILMEVHAANASINETNWLASVRVNR